MAFGMGEKKKTPRPQPVSGPQEEVPRGKTLRRLRWLLWLLILLPLLYILVQVVIILMPRMRTGTVLQEVMTDSLSVEGFVSLNSVPLYGGGVMYYTVPAGQRVSAGGEVALVYGSEAGAAAKASLEKVEGELAALEAAQAAVAAGGNVDVFLRQIEEGLMEYLQVLETGDYGEIGAPKEAMALAENRMQVATGETPDFAPRIAALGEQKAALEGQAAPSGSLTATETGYFVPAGRQDRIPKSYEELAAMPPKQMQAAMQETPSYFDSSVAGHIVTDYQWQFFTVVSSKDAEKFSEGKKLEITFPEVSGETMPVVVNSVVLEEATGLAKVELGCEYISPDILQLSMEKAEIIFSTEKGLRIEKTALRVIEGETCVYVKFGNQVYLRRVQVLVDGDPYFLIPETYEEGVNEVQLYDEVVVESGGVELYDKKIL